MNNSTPAASAMAGALRRKLRDAMAAQGHPLPNFPVPTATACCLLQILGYDASPRRARWYAKQGYWQKPTERFADRWLWTENDVFSFGAALEERREWVALHADHIHKLNDEERARHEKTAQANAAFDEVLVNSRLDKLLVMVTHCEDTMVRARAVAAISFKLRALGVEA